jgi:ABC-type antimicrobial peptide transport system ATPase subunit
MRGAHATEWRLPGGGSTAGLGAPQGRRRHRNGHRDATMVLLARTSVRRDSANDIGGGQYLRDLPSSRMADRETMLPPQQEACILTVSLRTEVSVSGKPNFVRDLGIAAHYCDKVAVMQAGRVIEINETRAFFDAPVHPYSKQLLDSVRL